METPTPSKHTTGSKNMLAQRLLPSILNSESWLVPASEADIVEYSASMLAMVEPDISRERVTILTRAISLRGYSKAELEMAANELPFDPRASHNFGRGFNPADMERIVIEHRSKRALLSQPITETQVNELCVQFAKELKRADFHVCGYTSRDERLYKHVPRFKDDNQLLPAPAGSEAIGKNIYEDSQCQT